MTRIHHVGSAVVGLIASLCSATVALAQVSTWHAEEVVLSTSTGSLAGTLIVPRSGSGYPLAILIAGSGPTDRDGNTSGAPTGSATLRLLAEGLAAEGIASIRYDKRSVGASRAAGVSESDLRFEKLADDAADWARKYRTDARFTTITIVGHSEGSLLGMLAAQRAPVDAFVSLAGPAKRADELLREQLVITLPPVLYAQADSVITRLALGDTVSRPPPELAAAFRTSVQPYLISWFRYAGGIEIAKLKIPILIAQGTHDFQVLPAEALALSAAAPRAKIVTVDGMNHVLKMSSADRVRQMQTSYVDPSIPIAPTLLSALVGFIQGVTPAK